MSIATSTAIAIAGGMAAVGGIASAAIGSSASGKAASEQEQASSNALDFQKQTLATNEANAAPYQAAGTSALSTLNADLPALTQGFDPTKAGLPSQFSYNAGTFQQDPGYQFALQQGQQAIQRSAAAKGGEVSGGSLKDLAAYTTGMAAQDYGNAYQRAQGTYQQNYSDAFNTYNSNQANTFNRLNSVVNTGLGANAAVAGTSENFANNASQIAIGAGNAAAAGTVGTANAINSGISGVSGAATNSLLLNQLLGGSANGSGSGYVPGSFAAGSFGQGAMTPNNIQQIQDAVGANGTGTGG